METHSEPLRATQSHSEPLRATQSHSEPLRTYLRPSEAIRAEARTREQQHDGERVEDRKPVDLVVTHVEVEVPARSPPACSAIRRNQHAMRRGNQAHRTSDSYPTQSACNERMREAITHVGRSRRDHRESHRIGDSSHCTSYVKMYSPASTIGWGGRSGDRGTEVRLASTPHLPL